MLKSVPRPLRALSTGQLLVLMVIAMLAIFLVIGSINNASAPEPTFNFGLQAQPFIIMALLAFAGGLLSFMSPCTLPILPAYFAFAFQSGRKQIATNTLMFMLGLATMFALLGATASAIGQLLRNTESLIILMGGSLVLVFGMMSLMGKGFAGIIGASARGTSLGGSYVFGVTFAVGWTGCTGAILGAVLTMAATSGSVLRGVFLLFIYTLGLGLPLIVVSTFLGRASRQSFFWRMLRGKGYEWNTHVIVLGLLWVLVVWQILIAVGNYIINTANPLAVETLTPIQIVGLLLAALVGVFLWIYTSPGKRKISLNVHSTQLVSGILFLALGYLMLNGTLASFNTLIPPDLAIWFAGIEERLLSLFS
jgi:cytochrome c-type biogenesis protein